MKIIELNCKTCSKKFTRPLKEHTRNSKKEMSVFCSRSCSGKANFDNFGDKRNTKPPPLSSHAPANPFNYYLRNCRRRTKFEMNLDLEYLKELWKKQEGKCAYTKNLLVLKHYKIKNPDIRYTASLDRIDNKLGYIKGNVQFVCLAINYMKSTLSDQQTKEFIDQIRKS